MRYLDDIYIVYTSCSTRSTPHSLDKHYTRSQLRGPPVHYFFFIISYFYCIEENSIARLIAGEKMFSCYLMLRLIFPKQPRRYTIYSLSTLLRNIIPGYYYRSPTVKCIAIIGKGPN